MKTLGMLLVTGVMAGSVWADGTSGMFRVTADRVNLRSRPMKDAEAVAQVPVDTILSVRHIEGEWAQVPVPSNIGVWISAAFVSNGVVTADRLLVRSGPGVTFRDIGVAHRGERLEVLETRGEWVRCRPPADTAVWIAAALLAPVPVPPVLPSPAAVNPEPAGRAAPAMGVTNPAESGPGTVVLPAGLMREELASVLGQGASVERQGTVDRVPIAFIHCSSYRLITTGDGRITTVCYLRGNDEQMPSLVGRRLWVRGREFWLRAEKYPLLFPDEIKPLADEPAVR
jgi:SH3-like domain-containing protein